MAYNTILQFEYKDINEVDTIVRVKQLDYAGAVTARDYVSAGAKFAWGDSSNNVPVIYGSQCTVYVDSESDYEFLYLFSSNARKHLVEVTKAGQLFWIGFIEPDSWSEPLVAAPYPVEFTAYDGLGMLDNIDFVDANGDPYTGTMTMIALIQQLLGNIGITLKLNTATDFKEEQQAAGTDYFEVHKVNLEAFEGMTCFEVLEQLLEGHRIQQRNGEWWITSYTLVPAGGSITYRTYTNGSDVSSGTVAQSIEDASSWWSEGEMSMNMLPALRNITLEQDYGYQKNILRNGDFSQLDANGKPKYWTSLYAFECYVKPLSSSGDVFLYVPKQAVSIPTMETLATSINNITAGNGNIKFSIDYAVISEAGNTANVFLQISFVASGGTIYYIQKNEETEEWEWVTSGTNYIQLNSFQLTGVSLADVDESFNSFTATLNALPSDGSLVIALMKPNSSYNIDGIGFKDAKIELLLNEDDNYEGSNAITVINNQNNNNVPDNIELVIGVIPQIANNEVIYKGGILRADGTPATGFAAGASAFYSWAELIGRVNASMQRNPRRAYEGTFADIIPRMNLVITDANNSNLRLIETGISYDDGIQAIQGQYVEVLSLSLVAGQEGDYVIKNAVSTGSSGSSGSGGSGSGAATSTANWDTLLNRPDWTNYFEIVNPGTASEYIRAKTNFAADGEVTAFAQNPYSPPTIWDAMPIASPSALGGVKVGNGLSIDANGVLSANVTGGVSSWDDLTDKPSWLNYGTIGEFQSGHTHAFSQLASKPTTLAGYGISDGVLTTDSRLSDARPASDVYAWAKSATKPSYTYTEVGAAAASHNHTGIYEPVFTKNTAFNKNFGTTAGTIAEGSDSRIANGQTAYGWGNHASAGYLAASSYTAADVLAKIKTVDGAGSGLDADLFDGVHSSGFASITTYTGVEPTISANNLTRGGYHYATDNAYQSTSFTDFPTGIGAGGFGLINVPIGTNYNFQLFKGYGSLNSLHYRSSYYTGGKVYTAWRAIWDSANSNLTSIPWSASSLNLAGAITGATSITASSLINSGGLKITGNTVVGNGSGLELWWDNVNSRSIINSYGRNTTNDYFQMVLGASLFTFNGGDITLANGGLNVGGLNRISATGSANFTSITGNGISSLYNWVGASFPSYSTSNLTVYDSAPYAEGTGGSITFTGKYNAAGTYLSGAPFIRAHKMNATDGDYRYGLAFGTRIFGGSQKISALLSDTYLTIHGNIKATGAIQSNSLFELRNSSDIKKWTFELSGDDLIFKNASGVQMGKLDQSGNFLAVGEITSYN